MSRPKPKLTAFHIFKYGVYFLLSINIFLFFTQGTVAEVIDQIGWVLLVAVFELETTSLDQKYASKGEEFAIVATRVFAYSLVLHAIWTYIDEKQWLDVLNAAVWIVVCITLEYDVYFPGEFGNREWKIRNALKIALYVVLLGCAVTWGITGQVLDFYDAFLWMLCFGVIELNIFRFETSEDEAPALDKAAPDPVPASE